MLRKIVVLAGFLAFAAAAPVSAQDLGLWQDRVGEGVSYGELPADAPLLLPTDPVRALPAAPRPVPPRPANLVAAAPKAVETPAPTVAPTAGPVGNFLLKGYDPDVPLPHPDLQGMQRPERRWIGPHPYARTGDGGGVFGLSVPLPADRATITTKSTRSGNANAAPEPGVGGR